MTTESKNQGKVFCTGVYLIIMAVWPLFDQPFSPGPGLFEESGFTRVAASSSVFMKALLVSGGAISLALCFLWYRLQGTREERGHFPCTIRRVLFLLGTVILVFASGTPGQQEVIKCLNLATSMNQLHLLYSHYCLRFL